MFHVPMNRGEWCVVFIQHEQLWEAGTISLKSLIKTVGSYLTPYIKKQLTDVQLSQFKPQFKWYIEITLTILDIIVTKCELIWHLSYCISQASGFP